MTDEQFFERVLAVISAAKALLDTDAVYGPEHGRTRQKKEQLAQAMASLMPDDVDLPQLRVIPGGGGDDA